MKTAFVSPRVSAKTDPVHGTAMPVENQPNKRAPQNTGLLGVFISGWNFQGKTGKHYGNPVIWDAYDAAKETENRRSGIAGDHCRCWIIALQGDFKIRRSAKAAG